MYPVGPIHTVDLFLPLGRELLTVLKSLEPGDWGRLTACAPWTVKDVTAHLLGGSLGRLKDHDPSTAAFGSGPISYNELLDVINRKNRLWVDAAKRINPALLIDFLEITDRSLDAYFRGLSPDEPATITVAWANDQLPPNWFDIAREYTEKWLHQQHIREAVEWPLLTEREWLNPVIDTFMRGLPRTFQGVERSRGSSASISIEGEAGGEWSLVRSDTGWDLYVGRDPKSVSHVRIQQDTAWRLFTKGISRDQARQGIQVFGDAVLGEKVLDLVAIMA